MPRGKKDKNMPGWDHPGTVEGFLGTRPSVVFVEGPAWLTLQLTPFSKKKIIGSKVLKDETICSFPEGFYTKMAANHDNWPYRSPTFLTCCWYIQKSGKIKSQCCKKPGNYQDKIPQNLAVENLPQTPNFVFSTAVFGQWFYDAQTFTVSWARFSKLAEKLPKQIRLLHATQKEQPILDGCLMFQPFPRQNAVSFIKKVVFGTRSLKNKNDSFYFQWVWFFKSTPV